MNRKNILAMIAGLLLLGGGCFSNSNPKEIKIDSKDIHKISFLDVTKNDNIIYTTDTKSFKVTDKHKQELDSIIISTFEVSDKKYYIALQNGSFGVLAEDFKTVVTFNFDEIEHINDKFLKVKEGDKFYLVDIAKYEKVGGYSSIEGISNGKIIKVTTSSGEEIYLNEVGEEIAELKDKNILFFRDMIAVTEKDGLYGLYDIKNNRYIPEENEEIYFSDKNLLVKREGKYYFNDKPLDIARFYPTMSDVVIYDNKEGFGLFNLRDGKFYSEVYDEVASNYDNYVIVGKKGRYGIINKYSDTVPQYSYDYIIRVGSNSFAGGDDSIGMFALIVADKKVTEERYENFIEINPKYYIALEKDNCTILNSEGKEIITCKKNQLLYYNSSFVIIEEELGEKLYILESENL